jgi:hypothetical protein
MISLYVLGIVVIIFPVVTTSLLQFSKADSINPGLFGLDSKPYGLTFAEWSEKWWGWDIGAPQQVNPGNDNTGKYCSVGQNDPNVWYLTGAGSGTFVRTCTVPAGRGIPISVAGNECSYAENPSLKTESELRACAISGDQVNSLQVSVDGKNLQNLQNYIVLTPLFNVTFPQNNIFGAPAGPSQAVSHSYFVFLKPLPSGTHTIHFSAVYLGNPETGVGATSYDVEYIIKVPNPVIS